MLKDELLRIKDFYGILFRIPTEILCVIALWFQVSRKFISHWTSTLSYKHVLLDHDTQLSLPLLLFLLTITYIQIISCNLPKTLAPESFFFLIKNLLLS
jgi:hypothetical protein